MSLAALQAKVRLSFGCAAKNHGNRRILGARQVLRLQRSKVLALVFTIAHLGRKFRLSSMELAMLMTPI